MLKKILYTSDVGGVYRPKLEVLFVNHNTKENFKVLGLLDSGADSILIPYSLGLSINLPIQRRGEKLIYTGGIGGQISLLERDCLIAIANSDGKKVFIFKAKILWAYPNENCQKELIKLLDQNKRFKVLQSGLRDIGSKKAIDDILETNKNKLNDMLTVYETTVLLGRDFFVNFSFLQFVQKERQNQSKFIYLVNKKKITSEINI